MWGRGGCCVVYLLDALLSVVVGPVGLVPGVLAAVVVVGPVLLFVLLVLLVRPCPPLLLPPKLALH